MRCRLRGVRPSRERALRRASSRVACCAAARHRAPVHRYRQSGMKPLALTMGDAAGIGPEIIAMCFRDSPERTHCCFVAGDLATMRRAAHAIRAAHDVDLPVALIETPLEALAMPPRCIPLLQTT